MKHSIVALAVGVAISSLVAPAYALTVSGSTASTSANITLNGLANTVTDGPAGSATSYATGLEDTGSELLAAMGESYAHADNTGHSDLRTLGPQYYFAFGTETSLTGSSTVHQSLVITNNDTAGSYVGFNFLITDGAIWLGFSNTYGSKSTISAGYSADIQVNGHSIWNSSAALMTDNVASNQLTLGGTTIGAIDPYLGFGYTWNDYSGMLNLGWLEQGESLTLDYYQSTFVDVHLEGMGYSHITSATFSDPFEFEGGPLFDAGDFVATTTPVPEPETVALMGAGLLALAFRRKKAS